MTVWAVVVVVGLAAVLAFPMGRALEEMDRSVFGRGWPLRRHYGQAFLWLVTAMAIAGAYAAAVLAVLS